MTEITDFLAGIGVNTHVDATTTGYGDVVLVQASLAYLGVSLIRDHAYDIDLTAYQTLAAAGVRLDLILDDDPKAELDSLVPIFPSIRFLEGPNEVDYQPVAGSDGVIPDTLVGSIVTAIAEQARVAAALAATPALLGTPLLSESMATTGNLVDFAGSLAFASVVNLHPYAAYGASPGGILANALATAHSLSPLPVAVTETGYYTMPTDESGVDESVQARLTLDTLFDAASLGIAPTFLYELLDEAPDPGNTDGQLHYGLFHADGSPKLVATALHNLTTILTAANAAPGLAPVVALDSPNAPDSANSMTLTGAAGTTVAVVWAEPTIWDPLTHTEITPPQTPSLITLGSTIASVIVYDPLIGTDPIATYANISSLTVLLTDHPLILQLSDTIPVTTTPPVTTDPPVVTTPPVTTDPPVVTTPPVTTDPPVVTTPPVTTDPPVVTTPPVTTDPPVVTTPPVTTDPPVVTTPPVTTDPPVVTTPPVTTDPPVVTTPPVTTDPPVVTTPPVTTTPPADTTTSPTPPATTNTPPPDPTTTAVTTDGASNPAATSAATIGIYRFFETTNGTHFYTASTTEAQSIQQTRPDLLPEGIGLRAIDPAARPADAAPVYRFFDTTSGTQFLTASAAERDTVIATRNDLKYESSDVFYEHATAQPGDTAVYRFFDIAHGTHFYTDSVTERATILSTRADLVAEGIGFYEPPSA